MIGRNRMKSEETHVPRSAIKEKISWYIISLFDELEKIFISVIWERRQGFMCLMCSKSNSGVVFGHDSASR